MSMFNAIGGYYRQAVIAAEDLVRGGDWRDANLCKTVNKYGVDALYEGAISEVQNKMKPGGELYERISKLFENGCIDESKMGFIATKTLEAPGIIKQVESLPPLFSQNLPTFTEPVIPDFSTSVPLMNNVTKVAAVGAPLSTSAALGITLGVGALAALGIGLCVRKNIANRRARAIKVRMLKQKVFNKWRNYKREVHQETKTEPAAKAPKTKKTSRRKKQW